MGTRLARRAGRRRGWRRAVLALGAVGVAALAVVFVVPAFADTSPAPVAGISAPSSALLGEQFGVTLTFVNDAPAEDGETGFGPYIDLLLPVQGVDGRDDDAGLPPDGISLVDGSVTYLGMQLNVIDVVLDCDPGQPDVHPYTGAPIDCEEEPEEGEEPANGVFAFPRAGDVLHVIELPFGSFTPTQPIANVAAGLTLSNHADLGVELPIEVRGGFRFGTNALDEPETDPPIVQDPPVTALVDPTLVDLRKRYPGPEDETATGPNYERVWRVELRAADGQTLEGVELIDLLPDQAVFVEATSMPAATQLTTPTPGEVGGEVRAEFDEIVASPGVDAQLDITFYVPESGADDEPVLDPQTGAARRIDNNASANGFWDPIDPRDGPLQSFALGDAEDPDHRLWARSIAVQQSVAVDTSEGGPSSTVPGAVLRWDVDFQVSDFFTFDDLMLHEVLSDGQSVLTDGPYVPRLSFDDPRHDPIDDVDVGDHVTIDVGGCDVDGQIDWELDLSAAIDAARDGTGVDDGRLVGGRVDGEHGPTQGRLTFYTIVDHRYRCVDDGQAVDSDDPITGHVTISGEVIDADSPTGNRPTDTSSASTSVIGPSFSKELYARNGVIGDDKPQFAATDTVTYRLTATLPITNVENLRLVDYLPLPTLRADELFDTTGEIPVANVDLEGPADPDEVPPAGEIWLGPDDQTTDARDGAFDPSAFEPQITLDPVGNAVAFDYPDYQDADGSFSTTIDLLFTVTVGDDPIADGLFLTNQLQLTYGDSFGEVATDDDIVQIELTAPVLDLVKGVVATDGQGTFDPSDVGPPGDWDEVLDGQAWWNSGAPISSDALADQPLGSDLSDVWAGDLIAFALVVENTGAGLHGAFDARVADTAPVGLSIPTDGPGAGGNLQVVDGRGEPLVFTGDLEDLLDPQVGLALLNDQYDGSDADESGSLGAYHPTSGENIAVITYVLEVDADVDVGQQMTNAAFVAQYAAAGDAEPYPPSTPRSADVEVAMPTVSKTLVDTAAGHTGEEEVAVGERATYEVVVTVPPSSTDHLVLRDVLDPGLAFTSVGEAALVETSGMLADAGAVLSGADVIGADDDDGHTIELDLGTVTNDTNELQQLVFTFDAVAANVAATSAGAELTNQAVLRQHVPDGPNTTLAGPATSGPVTVVEPQLTVDKQVSDATPDAADELTYTLEVAHPAGSNRATAFDVVLTDLVPAGLAYEPDSLEVTDESGTPLAVTVTDTDGDLEVTWEEFPAGHSVELTYTVVVQNDAVTHATAGVLANTATLVWTSLPSDDGNASDHSTVALQRTGDTSDPGGTANTYRDTATAEIAVATSAVTKTLLDTSAAHTDGNDVAIGETATFRLAVTLPEGELGTVTVTDELPAGAAYLPGSAEVCATDCGFAGDLGTPEIALDDEGDIVDGATLLLAFTGSDDEGVTVDAGEGTVASTFFVEYQAVVLDVAGNQHGGTVVNEAYATVAGVDTDPDDRGSVTLDIVGPELSVDKSFHVVAPDEDYVGEGEPPFGFVNATDMAAANDLVDITIEVANTSGVDAFDVVISDVLDDDVFAEIVDVALTSDPETPTDSWDLLPVDPPVTTPPFEVAASSDSIEHGESVTIVVRARVDDSQAVADLVGTSGHDNVATVTFASLPGDEDHQRAYEDTGTGTLRLVAPQLRVDKDGDEEITPGGTAEYTITVTNDGDRRADGVELVDSLPNDARVTFDPNDQPTAYGDGDHDPDPDGSGAHGTVTWQLGSLDPGESTQVAVRIGLVLPVEAGSAGDELTNLAAAEDDGSWGPVSQDNDQHIVEIDSGVELEVTKQLVDGDEQPLTSIGTGDEATYRITVVNTGDEHADDVTITDHLPAHVTVVGSASHEGVHDESDATVIWNVGELDAAEEGEQPVPAVVEVTVRVDDTVPAGLHDLVNDVEAFADDGQVTDTAQDSTALDAAPAFTITKTDDAGGLVHGGDTVVYTIEVVNVGDQGATGVVITDTLPDIATLIDVECTPEEDSAVEVDGVVTLDFGAFELDAHADGADDTIVCELTVEIDDVFPDGLMHLDNHVHVTDDDTNAPDPVEASDTTSTPLNATSITKQLVSTSAGHTNGSEVVIGEEARFTLTLRLPEGDLGEVVIRDRLDAGLAYVEDSLEVDTAGFDGTIPDDPNGSGLTVTGGVGGDEDLRIEFDEVTVNEITFDNGDPVSNIVTVTYDVEVLDTAGNTHGTTRGNDANVTVDGASFDAERVEIQIVEPELELAKQFTYPDAHADDTVGGAAIGDRVVVELTVENTSDVDAFTVTVTDALDTDWFDGIDSTDADGWDVSVDSGSQLVTFTVPGDGRLGAGEQHTVTITTRLADDRGEGLSHVNEASTSFTSLPDGDGRLTGDVTDTDTLTVIAPDLTLTKTTGDTQVEPGGTVTYTLTVANDGDREASGVEIVDTLPATVTFESATSSGVHDNGTVTWQVGDLAVGADASFDLEVTVVDPVPAGTTTITNTAVASDDGTRAVHDVGDSASAVSSLDAAVNVRLAKTADVAEVATGGEVTYTLTVTNDGNEDAAGVELVNVLPAHTSFVAATGGGVHDAGTVTWTLDVPGELSGDNVRERQVTVRLADTVPAGLDAIDNDASVDAPDNINVDGLDASVTVDVDAAPDVTVTKDDGQDVALVGTTLVYEIVVTNVGDQGATGVEVVDELPDGLTFQSASGGGTHDDGTVTWQLGAELAAGDDVTLTLQVTVDDPLPAGTTSLTNVVHVADDGANGTVDGPAPKSDTDTNATGADIWVEIELDDPLVPGATGSYTITVGNHGPETISAVTLVPSLPSGLSSPSFDPDTGSYSASNDRWTGLSLAPGDEVSMTMTVNVATSVSSSRTTSVDVLPVGHADANLDDNEDDTTDAPSPRVALELTKDIDGDPQPGEMFDYVFEIGNDGPSRARGVVVRDTFPAGVTPVASSGSGWSCDLDGREVTCELAGSLSPGDTKELRIRARVADDATGEITNLARVGSDDSAFDDADEAVASFVLGTAARRVGTVAMTGLQVAGLLAAGLALVGAGTTVIGALMRRRLRP